MSKNIEILQASSLEDCNWPINDPHSVPQKTRERTENDVELVRQCLNSSKIDKVAFEKNCKKDALSLVDKILRVIAHEKFQMNGKEVRNEERWKECVIFAIQNNSPIDIVYPQFCVIPNAPKRYTNVSSAAGEDCTIEFFKLLNEHIKWYHKPGIVVHALADASLYASAFQTHQTEVNAYFESLQTRIKFLKAENCVKLYDYAELLRTKCPEYQELYFSIGKKVWKGEIEDLLPNTDIPTLRRSVRCSVNTRRFQLSHKEHLALFGPDKFRDTEHKFWKDIENMTDYALREVVTIRLSCGEIDIATKLWPNAIRASCHKGKKNGRWAMGLRTYPEYFGSCRLLPYHGMPLIKKSIKGKPKLEIVPEVLLRGRDDLVRVTIENSNEVYTYIETDIDIELGNCHYETPIGMLKNEKYEEDKF